jgi:hypothetical protein
MAFSGQAEADAAMPQALAHCAQRRFGFCRAWLPQGSSICVAHLDLIEGYKSMRNPKRRCAQCANSTVSLPSTAKKEGRDGSPPRPSLWCVVSRPA